MEYTHENVNRVYLNPNFNRTSTSTKLCSTNGYMHINPKFQHLLLNKIQNNPSVSNMKRIYVNPNFIRSELNTCDGPSTTTSNNTGNPNGVLLNVCPDVKQKSTMNQEVKTSAVVIRKSRYNLVRNNENKSVKNTLQQRQCNTIKISKYKSIAVNTLKKNIDNAKVKALTDTHVKIGQMKLQNRVLSVNRNYKVAKTVLSKPLSDKQRNLGNKKHRVEKQSLKKNNIPCPLFKKFGKCLRSYKGYCDYLHDKKHVNICRKFLKGCCHDTNCLLSHDLTAKKMPTCYFYLNAVCAKENCPYIHVKLNDKTKLCPDFLKGYCDKANDCPYRHINVNRDVTIKQYSKKKFQFKHSGGAEQVKQNFTNKDSLKNESSKGREENEYRYYKDSEGTFVESEKIKPSRCKLGALPSFIQL